VSTPADLTNAVTFAGYRFDQGAPKKITNDFSTPQEAGVAIQAYAKNIGLDARDIYFYLVKETVAYQPISKTRFTVSTVTEPA
jgi:hypothetical protein